MEKKYQIDTVENKKFMNEIRLILDIVFRLLRGVHII